ncbi:MAG: patatin-like phospholipase family protein [Gammaproteobacteria bacterium]|nr:MAG: patatin-like phospholipase family protein [Gammaproteobacteria bacterium]
MTTALVLSGGGARAAYQVGVLKALGQILPRTSHNPFPIICGTSAGAINALAIAGRPGPFRLRARKLEAIWRNMHAEHIYRTDVWGVLKNTVRLSLSLMHSGYGIGRSVALLDNSPLENLLTNYIRFRHIDEAILSGELMAVSTTAMDYVSGKSVAFFQGNHDCWTRSRRHGIRTGLNIDHLMASSAIPLIFPARAIDTRYYGDGAMRQLKPLSPALHLGADRIFVIGVSDNPSQHQDTDSPKHSPSVAQMIGHLLNSAFIDSVESDLETLKAINKLVQSQAENTQSTSSDPDEQAASSPLKYIEHLCISPSTPIDEIAQEYFHELPQSVKLFLRAIGATKKGGGSSATSYLLFEPGFCRQLIKLGYADAMEQKEAIEAFFGLDKLK